VSPVFIKGVIMETEEAVKGRRSIRHFLKKPISKETINEIIQDSLWSPSWGNTQPWEFLVATGPVLEQFKKENREAFFAGKKANPDIPVPEKWPGIYKERYNDLGKNLLSSIPIAREDHEGRLQYYGQMFSLFDAPALLLILLDKELSLEYAMLDVGLVMQTFFLLAQSRGVGTIPLAVSINYPEIIRRLLSVPDNKRIVIGVALGWPDQEAPINCFERKRGKADEVVRWIGQ
jgi:nitroreductase